MAVAMAVAWTRGAAAAPVPDEGASWIAGGDEVDARPYVVQVLTDESACTGSVISQDRRWVLTAADCIAEDTPQDGVLVSPGEEEEPLRSVQWRAHPGFGLTAEVALVEVAQPLGSSVRLNDDPMGDTWREMEVTLAGFGETAEGAGDGGVLREVQTRVAALDRVTLRLESDERGACEGDQGGPVVAYAGELVVQVGVVIELGCGTRPDVAVRLDELLPWLDREGVVVNTSSLPSLPSHVCALADAPTEPLASEAYVVQPAEVLCQLGPGVDPERRYWDWDDGSDLEPVHPVAPGRRTFTGPGFFRVALCSVSDDGGGRNSCQARHSVVTCLAPDASFSVFGEAPEVTVRGEPELDRCRLGETWQVLDEDGAEVPGAFQAPSTVVFDAPGTYRIVHTLQTEVGDDVAEETVVFSEAVSAAEPGECGCQGHGSGGTPWLLLGLGGLLLRRRRTPTA